MIDLASVWIVSFNAFASNIVGPVHCLWDTQVVYFNKFFFKTESYDTIHTFKNYFVTVFLVFQQ